MNAKVYKSRWTIFANVYRTCPEGKVHVATHVQDATGSLIAHFTHVRVLKQLIVLIGPHCSLLSLSLPV